MSDPVQMRRFVSPSGLSITFNANASIARIDQGDILINLFPGNELEGGPANCFLRVGGVAVPLLGPRAPSRFAFGADRLVAQGEAGPIHYELTLVLGTALPSWFWHLSLHNRGTADVELDVIHTQDIGLCSYWAARNNEYYVSQYVDHTPLSHKRGTVIASRQNQAVNGKNPWSLVGCLDQSASFATDALQVFGLSGRESASGKIHDLPGVRHQHEHSMAALQSRRVTLAPGESSQGGFFGGFVAHHPEASSPADLALVDQILAQPEALPPARPSEAGSPAAGSLFTTAPLLQTIDLVEPELDDLFGPRREVERDAQGTLLSFFAREQSHIVTRAKELSVLRPHGHMLRTGTKLTPDESALTSTCWMSGVFHSQVTQGHVGINRLISTTRSYLGLFRSQGVRVFAEIDGRWTLLDVPSAFEMTPGMCRWIYKHAGGLIEVESIARSAVMCLRVAVRVGPATRFLISTHVASNGDDGAIARPVSRELVDGRVLIRTIPQTELGDRFPSGGFSLKPMKETRFETVAGDELLFADGMSRHLPYLCLVTERSEWAGVKIIGELVPQEPAPEIEPGLFWSSMTRGLRLQPASPGGYAGDVLRLGEMLPWFAQNALVHYLAPRGLEQYSGGGWGTRDVTQGPVEMLLSIGKTEPVRDLLTRVFKQQNPDGDWPQWFMFFDRERHIRPGDSHGDIVFWPLLALAQYLIASGDKTSFDDPIDYFDGTTASLLAHVERALALIESRVIPNTHLAAYGHGDWNDSLQPADPSMRERLCSSWTVTLHYQTLQTLACAFERLGLGGRAMSLRDAARLVLDDFQRLLIVDDVITGYAYFHDDGHADYLLHPRDAQSGVKYSALPMIHAIANDMLTEEQVVHHLDVIKDHLLAPDGIRLFDRPLPYRGGLMKFFQRAETATFFGREIGLMYTHAHLRFVEALARWGDADLFIDQLCRAVPIDLRSRVPTATPRQSNCYYSSSDALFLDRYKAFDQYERALHGEIAYEGGWRIYSSGAGISMAMILRCFLGFREECARLAIDPVLPSALDGLRVELQLVGKPFEVTYRVGKEGCGVNALHLNDKPLPFERDDNPYRVGGAEVDRVQLERLSSAGVNRLVVTLG